MDGIDTLIKEYDIDHNAHTYGLTWAVYDCFTNIKNL